MFRTALAATALVCLATSAPAAGVDRAPPPAPFRKVSDLVKLPDLLPGLRTLYVDPSTLPAGPFLAYDHKGRLVSTVYMIPMKTIDDKQTVSNLKASGPCRPLLQCRSPGGRGAALPCGDVAYPQS
jgi:hypothetical protein